MSRARAVRWMLEETGVPHRTEVLELGTTKNPALEGLSRNMRTSPALASPQPTSTAGMHVGMGMQVGMIESRPSFAKHGERVRDRPAYRRAKELDDALVPNQT